GVIMPYQSFILFSPTWSGLSNEGHRCFGRILKISIGDRDVEFGRGLNGKNNRRIRGLNVYIFSRRLVNEKAIGKVEFYHATFFQCANFCSCIPDIGVERGYFTYLERAKFVDQFQYLYFIELYF